MKFLGHLVWAFFLAFAVVAPAADSASAPHYLDPATINLKTILPDPPADSSAQTQQEISLLLQLQVARTPEQIARAQSEAKLSPFIFADTLGSWFAPAAFPVTAALLENVHADCNAVIAPAKKIWNRPRPPLQDARIKPGVELPDSGSYPSGHSTLGTVFAAVLEELAPDLKAQIEARGIEIGDDRMAMGVHFPSDVEAGRTLGHLLAARFLASPAFQTDLAAAKAEFARARPKP